MSDWRITLRELHDAGGSASDKQFGTFWGRRCMMRYGLATRTKYGRHYLYQITDKGRDVIEGRIAMIPGITSPSGRRPWRWVATWLASLPRPEQVWRHTR